MRRNVYRSAALVSASGLALGLLAGCGAGKDVPFCPYGLTPGTLEDVARLVRAAVVPGAVLPTNLSATASRLFTLDVDGLRGASAMFHGAGQDSLVTAFAVKVAPILPGSTRLLVDGHDVCLQGELLTVYTTFLSYPLGVGLPFDGTTFHRFDVQGSALFPTLVDSVQSVTEPAIAVPAAGASVPRSSDLAVSWSNAGADTTVYTIVAVVSLTDTTKFAVGPLVRDVDAATTLPAARLGLLPAGLARLSVARFRTKIRNLSGQVAAIFCEAATTQTLTLQ